jgi:hypothetical protein
MSGYPTAQHPGDNASLRPYYGKSHSYEVAFVKGNNPPNGLWLMRNTDENRTRYNQIFDSDNPPKTRIEALERAGATFFPHCIYLLFYTLGQSSDT